MSNYFGGFDEAEGLSSLRVFAEMMSIMLVVIFCKSVKVIYLEKSKFL
jgi:hypothetical protein